MQNTQQQNMTPQQAIEQAVKLTGSGNLQQAENLCRRILQIQPDFHPAYFQLGILAIQVGKFSVAANMMTQALQYDQTNPDYHRAIGEIFRRLGQLKKAMNHGQQATKLAPQGAENFYNLGLAFSDAGLLQEAVEAYKSALKINPSHGFAANNMGTALENLKDENAAIEAYRQAIKINVKHAEAQNNLGAILSARGDLEEAKACFTAAIQGDPNFVYAHYNLSTLKKYTKGDPHLAALEGMLKNIPQLSVDARMRYWFSIGKAWEDTERYNDAFEAYQKGNKLKRASFQYNVSNIEKNIQDIINKFDRVFADKKISACDDETPIFIVGMPRSGTTLIEQILSSHSKVYGAGELQDFSLAVAQERQLKNETDYIDWLLSVDDSALKRIGENYIKRIRALDAKAIRISDKMPGNFFYVGLIHKALPKAKIIHSIRNPMDVCVSNYSRLFNESMPFAYDLEELGRYSYACDKLMTHWKEVLPKGVILDMVYEDNVADLETQARKLLRFCDLEWEEACLEFHKNKRHVKTASIAQVRKPIYKSSVARWEHYKDYLAPLQAAIKGEEIAKGN